MITGRADWVSVGEARQAVLARCAPAGEEERPLLECLGRVLAEEVRAPMDLPPWDNSAMDGFAVRREDVLGASDARPRVLRVIDDVAAGDFPRRALEAGAAVRVMTGAPVPAGTDGVIRVEHTDGGSGIGDGEGRVEIRSDADAQRNVRPRGEDVRRGATQLRPGRLLRAAEIGLAASLGRARLRTVRAPVVGILATGDELVDLDEFEQVLEGRRIVSSNSYALAAQVGECGCASRSLGIARDTPASITERLAGAAECDVLITSAGVSVGEHDHVRGSLASLGLEAAFWRVRMRPGSPFAFGRIAGLGGIPWFGLPGNPVSSMVTFEIFVRPALMRMLGHQRLFPTTRSVRLLDAYDAPPGLMHFPRLALHEGPGGELDARLTGPQGSGILTSMAGADALGVIPESSAGAAPGDVLQAILLGSWPLQATPGY